MTIRSTILAVAALLLLPGAAWAKDAAPCAADLVCASDPPGVSGQMMRGGYQALLSKDKGGDPMVESAAAGYKFYVYFYGCDHNVACDGLQFYASFDNEAHRDAGFVNKWNLGKRFAQMSLDNDGTIILRYDVTTVGGVNHKNFADTLDWWVTMLGQFDKFVDANPAPAAPPPRPAAAKK